MKRGRCAKDLQRGHLLFPSSWMPVALRCRSSCFRPGVRNQQWPPNAAMANSRPETGRTSGEQASGPSDSNRPHTGYPTPPREPLVQKLNSLTLAPQPQLNPRQACSAFLCFVNHVLKDLHPICSFFCSCLLCSSSRSFGTAGGIPGEA